MIHRPTIYRRCPTVALDRRSGNIGDSHPALAALQLDNISSDSRNTLLEDQARMRETESDVTLEDGHAG